MTDDRKHRIERRAYLLWEEEGRPEGRHEDHWQLAELETRDDVEDAAAPDPLVIPSNDDPVTASTPLQRGIAKVADEPVPAQSAKRATAA